MALTSSRIKSPTPAALDPQKESSIGEDCGRNRSCLASTPVAGELRFVFTRQALHTLKPHCFMHRLYAQALDHRGELSDVGEVGMDACL